MKLKVYEVERIRDDGSDEYKLKFLYLDYANAVDRFKKLIEEEKKVDWIEEVLSNNGGDAYVYELTEGIDHWGFYTEYMLDRMYSEVTITEREVF